MKLLTIFFLIFTLSIAQSDEITNIIEESLDNIVMVQTDNSIGSGVVVAYQGYILTNFHVVESAIEENSLIKIKTHEKEFYNCLVIDYDSDLDICLLQAREFENYSYFQIEEPDNIKIGESVVCIGNPFGISEYVTNGIISKYNTPYVFTTSSINPGNSGGALINSKGKLIGIPTSSIAESQNLNLALCPRTILYFLKKNKIK